MRYPILLLVTILSVTVYSDNTLSEQNGNLDRQSSQEQADGSMYQTLCASCHGDYGEESKERQVPGIAGLATNYIKRQLTHFREGIRGNGESPMNVVSAQLKDHEIQTLANHINRLTLPLNKSPTKELSKEPHGSSTTSNHALGKRIFQSNCAACHGQDASGNESLNAPTLLVQGDWYLQLQMKQFINDKRGHHPKDKLGKQMQMMAKLLKDQPSLTAVINYVQSLSERP